MVYIIPFASKDGVADDIATSDISYFDMKSGIWEINIQLPGNITVTRTFTLTVGAASTVITTVSDFVSATISWVLTTFR